MHHVCAYHQYGCDGNTKAKVHGTHRLHGGVGGGRRRAEQGRGEGVGAQERHDTCACACVESSVRIAAYLWQRCGQGQSGGAAQGVRGVGNLVACCFGASAARLRTGIASDGQATMVACCRTQWLLGGLFKRSATR